MPDNQRSLGLARTLVRLVDHRETWADDYALEVAALRPILGADLLAAAHIGSTAIRGIAAKPVIDLMVAVPNLDAAERHRAALERAGYERRPNGDLPDRRFFAKGPRECRTHHLSFTRSGSDYWRVHLAFRDYLNAHPPIAAEYDVLKRRLAAQFANDRSSYTQAKVEFITRVNTLAAAWQDATARLG